MKKCSTSLAIKEIHIKTCWFYLTLVRMATIKNTNNAGCQWLMLIILPTQEAEIRRIEVCGQPGQIVLWDSISKSPYKKGLVEWLMV
jgi:hypothetical protein